MSAQISYLKGVRTRYLHVLQKELSDAATLLDLDVSRIDVKDVILKINVSVEKMQSYAMKLESQSEKVVGALDSSDEVILQGIIDEDSKVMCEVTDMCAKLKEFSCSLQITVHKEKPDRANIEIQQLLEAQLQMQREILEKQCDKKPECVRSVKLPKLEMGSFNGNKLRWHEFWDSFESAVHQNESLSEIDKFIYLRSKLTGDARSAIAGLSLSNGNYTVAVKILKDRFGNKQEVIDLLYNTMLNITPAQDRVESLRRFLDTLNKNLRSLEVLGQNVNQDVFIALAKSKLPSNVIKQLEIMKGSNEKWSIMRLKDYLSEYVLASERAEKPTSSVHRPRDSVVQPAYNSGWRHSRTESRISVKPEKEAKSSVEALAAGPVERNKQRCRYCSATHWSDECQQYSTVDERRKRIKGSCLRCLKDNHATRDCKSKSKVCVYCGERDVHHRSLCLKRFKKSVVKESAVVADETEEECQEESALLSSNESVVMQTACAKVKNERSDEESVIRILFDSGSNRTYISEDMAKRLKLKYEGEREIRLLTFGSDRSKAVKTRDTTVSLKLKDGSYMSMCVSVVPTITGSSERKPVSLYNSDKFMQLTKDLILADSIPTKCEKGFVDLLIGNDYYLDIVQSERIEIQPGLFLLNSKLGWIITGRTSDQSIEIDDLNMLILSHGNMISEHAILCEADKSIPMKPSLEDFWNVESIGVIEKEDNKTEDEIAMESFKDKIQFKDGRYQVVWPWKSISPELPENRGLALGRLSSLSKKLSGKDDLMQKYDSIIKEQEIKGIIEKVKRGVVHGKKHYLPHHAVLTPLKTTTKVRIVYDASAKTRKENLSLNECLCRGPVLLQDLCGILLRFRLHKVGMIADIEKAFHQIGLQESERDVTRFLWFKDFHEPNMSEDYIQEWRFRRVPFGVISSPFLLSATVEHHLDLYKSMNADKVKDDIYMDNVVTGTDSVEQAKELYTEIKEVFNDAHMNLREWTTNSAEIREFVAKSDLVEEEKTKVLGHVWSVNTDTISLNKPKIKNDENVVTKRTVLKNVSSIFDPMGLFGPVSIKGKILIQKLWRQQLEWDDPIDDPNLESWKEIRKDIQEICELEIDRCVIRSSHDVTFSLLCFCDASIAAYGTAIYLIQECSKEKMCDLIFAKSRLAPIKTLTIPRLELLAVLVGVRCVKYVESQLKLNIKSISVLTDSQCVLSWIVSKKKQPVFIENRLKEIRSHSTFKFVHVRSENNPADILSRGCSASELKVSDMWWHGPAHMPDTTSKIKDDICAQETKSDEVQDDEKQQVKGDSNEASEEISVHNDNMCVANESSRHTHVYNSPFGIDINRYSDHTKVLRVTAWCQRFIDRLRRKPSESKCLSSVELTKADNLWIKHIQRNHFADVFSSLPSKKPHNLVKQLGIFIDNEGILRCHGRLEHSELSNAARMPILLPNNTRYVHLLIEKQHKRLMHSGVSQTLSTVRQHFWIIRGRAIVRNVLKRCIVCRRVEGPPYTTPPMAPLPSIRANKSVPFSTTGVDYFGPLYVKDTAETQKVWVCLFTCGVTRAVHLEMVPDLTTKSFLMCLRRFIAVRGTPDIIISDNAKQFKLAHETLKLIWSNILSSEDIQDYSTKQGIQWKFITEMAPWMGGFYERLVGIVKRSLKKAIGKRVLQSDHLNTVLKEAEAIVNSRPLVYVDEDIHSTQTLTPNHFLSYNRKTVTPQTQGEHDPDFKVHITSADKVLDMWKKGEKLTNMFWKIWKNDYLQNLRERHQQNMKYPRVKSDHSPSKGDIVLVKDDLPRGQWKVGKIENVIVSRDGLIRSAVVRVEPSMLIKRPTNMLFPLEISSENNNVSTIPQITQNKLETSTRPKRQAAKKALDKMKEIRI